MSVTAGSTDQAVRFDYDDFVRHTEMHPEANFELLDGVIYELAPEGKAHKVTRLKINTYLHRTVDLRRYTVGTEASFPAPGWKDGPKPDNFVSRGALLDGDDHEPTAEDMLLVIEIVTLHGPEPDRILDRKLATYAKLSIPEYWLVDLVKGSVIVHLGATGEAPQPAYQSVRSFGRSERIASAAVDDLSVDTDFLLKLAIQKD